MALTDDDFNWIDDNKQELKEVEAAWKKDVAKTQTDEALVEAFPQEKEIVVRNLLAYWQEAQDLYKKLVEIRNIVDKLQADKFSRWFYFNAEKFREGKKLQSLQEKIARLERLKLAYEKKEVQKHLSKEFFKTIKERERFDIDKMFLRENLLVDIAAYYLINMRQTGVFFKALCPFHNEKTPSFFIYRNNWYHCFGCQAHGNFIDFIMKLKNMTFREALEETNNFL